jgi:hypothetical protein
MPAIKRALGDKFQYTETELKKVLQNLHRHRRDAYTVSLNPLKSKANKQRTGINSRRKDVSTSFNICNALLTNDSIKSVLYQIFDGVTINEHSEYMIQVIFDYF